MGLKDINKLKIDSVVDLENMPLFRFETKNFEDLR